MVKLDFILVSLLLLGTVSILASEPDQFTRRFDPPMDSSAAVNRRLNQLLQTAIDKANEIESRRVFRVYPKESEAILYAEMRNFFNNHTKSEFVRDLRLKDKADDGIERQRILKADSIYKEWKLSDGYLIGSRNADRSPLAIAPLIRMGEVTIGIDKIEHLFERGWVMFDENYRRGKSVDHVIYMSNVAEKVIFGGNIISTGVFSYADAVANFNGMRFWNDVLHKHDDILGKHENAGPYVLRLDGGGWRVNPDKPIDLNHYIDWGMDEGINCSRYATHRTARKVLQALADLSERDPDHAYVCPMDSAKFEEMWKKYGNYSPRLLNHRGIGKRGFFFYR